MACWEPGLSLSTLRFLPAGRVCALVRFEARPLSRFLTSELMAAHPVFGVLIVGMASWDQARRASVCRLCEPVQWQCVAPLDDGEQFDLVRRMRASRPGPSGFKLGFLALFPEWIQKLYWSFLDLQRGTGIVAS